LTFSNKNSLFIAQINYIFITKITAHFFLENNNNINEYSDSVTFNVPPGIQTTFFRDSKVEINRKELNPELNRFVRKAKYNRGFTLIELLVVVAIVGILASLAMAGYTEFTGKAKIARATEEIRGIEKQIFAYATDQNHPTIPATLDEIGRQYLKDPWGNNYVYAVAPPSGSPQPRYFSTDTETPPLNSDFYLYSKGPNGTSADSIIDNDSLDDIIRASDGAFCALSSKYGSSP
jgi:prepilin-type N-terminal cleavage/methylation domain-containing protein